MWDSFQISAIIAKNLYFLCLWNPSCIRKSVPTYACFGPRMQAVAHVRGLRATLVILFPKIDFCSFKRLYLPFPHSLSQFDIWLGSKLALGHRVCTSLGNGGPIRKGYKMQCQQMPIFWFISFTNRIKRIRDKTFCFDVRSGPIHAHDTHHTYMGWGATPESCVGLVSPKSHICYSGNKQW